MSTIVTRAGKGSALTHNEVDANFNNLNTDKVQSGNTVAALTITTATINGGAINNATVGATTPSSGSFTSVTDSGNLNFTGTGNRITGDFSNSTIANRLMFQTSTANSVTQLHAIPNGTVSVGAAATVVNLEDSTSISTGNGSVGNIGNIQGSEIRIASGARGTGTFLPMTFYTGGSERMRVTTTGDVGIGTSSPGALFDVQKNNVGATTFSRVYNPDTSGTSAAQFQVVQGTVQNAISAYGNAIGYSGTLTNHPLALITNNTERARIDSSGNLLVNRTTRLNNGKIEALASTSEQAVVAQVQTNANSLYQGFNAAGSITFYVVGTGGIFSTSTTITAISDVSQKENIRPIEYGIAEVCALKPVKFDFKEGCASEEKDLIGFIAQDVEPVLPELVKPFGDDGLKGLKTGDMIPVLVKAIQEQQAMIEELKAKVAALENK